jgi:MSHA pilin protein MshD
MSTERPWPCRRQRGLTLIELIMFIVIVSVAVVSVLQVISINTAHSVDPVRRKQALAIAESMLEEIELAKFSYCDANDPNAAQATSPADCSSTLAEAFGQEPGGIGRPYDNVNDYVSASGVATAYTTDAAGNGWPAGYAVSVTITADSTLGPTGATIPSGTTPAAMNALRISVSVTFGQETIQLEGFRTRYAPTAL